MSQYTIDRLGQHDRSLFDCGSSDLNRYLRERVSQDIRRRVTSCFVALDRAGMIAGFYTMAATSLAVDQLPAQEAKRLPRYPIVPAVLLGRLAVSLAHQGKGLGEALVVDAMQRSTQSEVMIHAMVVDAIDQRAAKFYRNLAFEPSCDNPLRLFRKLR